MVSSENKGMPLLTPNLDEFGFFASSTLNVDELIGKIGILENNINYLKKHINYYNKKSFLNLYSNISREDRLKKKEAKNDISSSKKVIKENKKKLEIASSFDVDLLANFITDLLSSKKGAHYTIKEVILTDQFSGSGFYKSFYFISTNDNIDLLSDLYTDNGIAQFYKTLKNFSEDEYVLLELDKKYNYYNTSKKSLKIDDFKGNPYINEILKKVVNIKLCNEVSDEEIFDKFYNKYSIKKSGKAFIKRAR